MKICSLTLLFLLTTFSFAKAQISVPADSTEPGRIFFKAITEKDSSLLINYFQPSYSEIEHLMTVLSEMDTLGLDEMKEVLSNKEQKDSVIMYAYNKARKHAKRSYEECLKDLEELGIDPSKMILKRVESEISEEYGMIYELKTYLYIEYKHKLYFLKLNDSILLEAKWRGVRYRYVKVSEDQE